ncbi:4Fe-4S binding protein [Xanthomonas sp. AmX2]|uniref:4Fe-4S dicluster domain-containing protein n=1 Tax=Xanthomonas sp. TaxID=29446 RepID=UPI001982349B|nr:4Fe-4S dicluster domain-containing protein [Xanthomonas sp.]MBN6152647.1 4Fe-4S binding protein [Xanthomonas sp.]
MPRPISVRLLDRAAPGTAPSRPGGRYRRWRGVAILALLGAFCLLPWVRWHGRQALLFDLPARRLDVFALALWPQDFAWLALAALAAAAALALFTTLAGRLWCGAACPQSIWSEAFAWIERRTARRPAAARHLAWAALALWTGVSFVGYFVPIADLVARLRPFAWSGWETFWVLFYALATWGNAGFLRSQVCRYLCPYARLQPLLCDRDTPGPGYDAMRGEPRGARMLGLGSVSQRQRRLLDPATAHDYATRASLFALASHEGVRDDLQAAYGALPKFAAEQLGDCVDCAACVDACPSGIDLRNGAHYACVTCGACIEACDRSMQRFGFPHGLLRYASPNAIDRRPRRWLRRPRVLAGLAALALLLAWWAS